MSFTSLIYSASTNKELVTFIAHLGDANTKEHFVIIRGNGELVAYDSAYGFVDDALSFFSKGYKSTSMYLDGKIYSYSEEEVKYLKSYLSEVLRCLTANKVN